MALRTYLHVPFPEKDQAKSLGARWDPMERKWYVQVDDLGPFRRWIITELHAESTAPSAAPLGTADNHAGYQVERTPSKGMSLLDFMLRMQATVEAVYAQPVWVRVEINQVKQSQGHWFLELVEHDVNGVVVASSSGTLWRNNQSVLQKFQLETGVALSEGIKLLLAVQPRFNPRFGLKLDILGIDSAFTLGDMAAKLNRIRDILKGEGIFLNNKRLLLPADFQHVAVISPSGAASLGDFRAEADRLQRLGICRFSYFETTFQGPSAAADIRHAMDKALRLHDKNPLDALVIIRGGGSAADLFWLNDEDLARQICRYPLPVITGIGHEPDNTILDEVAARRCDTPSKVAQLILTTIADTTGQAEHCMQAIREHAGHVLQHADRDCRRHLDNIRSRASLLLERRESRLEQDQHEIISIARQLLVRQEDRLGYLMQGCRESGFRHLQSASSGLQQQWRVVQERTALHLQDAETRCEHLIHVILALGPEKTLKRGYGILRTDGRVVTTQGQVAVGADFSVQMQDGVLHARRTT
ncbi:MAG: exodeoxyribonuclease VII large subunit [Fluviicoccus sp.]|uniref:exodeoxyribonuclease VII large subunit n=1 Tax=Fluviicoccus sp. TaxID=2003552 RepID=UPI0027206756|nr:exodeoxyribonuclease VII large subunit [Fluviicoccus sp.]MDO8329194.1 exodeoxyribonuclease VII large subunit [Fluviicoccus sp.]